MSVRWRWVLVGIAVVVVASVGWSAYQAYRVNQALSDAASDASRLRVAVEAGDEAGTARAVADLRRHSTDAASRTDGLTWRLLGHAPVVGDDAHGVAVASAVLADLSDDGLDQLLTVWRDLGTILPRSGRVPVGDLDRLDQPVSDGAASFTDAEARLNAVDPSSFVDRLRSRYRDLAQEVGDAAAALRAADTAIRVLPPMLGQDGPRHYLLVFQNNAEIRSTGGLPGAVSLVTATDGRVALTKQVAGKSFGERPTPVLPLTPAERQIYGDQLGTYFLDANFTPDFPRTAELMRARWQEVYPGPIDGVIAIDPVTLSYVLEATGPVEVGGTTLTADNVVDVLLHQVYVDYPQPAAQDAFFRLAAKAVFDKVTRGISDPVALARGLARAAGEHRIYVRSFDRAVQDELRGASVEGEVTDPAARGPQVGVYLNDGTGSKMSYYLRYDAAVDATWCSRGVQGLSGSIRLTSQAPEDARNLPFYVTGGGAYGVKPGDQLVNVRIFGPVDGEISDVQLQSRPLRSLQAVVDDRRPVVTVPIELAPGETTDLEWRMKSGADQTGTTTVSVTPSIVAGQSSSMSVSACA